MVEGTYKVEVFMSYREILKERNTVLCFFFRALSLLGGELRVFAAVHVVHLDEVVGPREESRLRLRHRLVRHLSVGSSKYNNGGGEGC